MKKHARLAGRLRAAAAPAGFLLCSLIILWIVCFSSGDVMDRNVQKVLRHSADGAYIASGSETLAEQLGRLAESIRYQGSILVAKDGRILYAAGFGDADESGTPNRPDTVFAVGSVSKQFTAAAILQLASAGRLSLAEPVSDFFPDYPDGGRISVKQLLNMDSGVGRDFWSMAYALRHYTSMAQADEFQAQHHEESELLQLVYDSPLEFEPGSQYMYSNVNYYLLSLIVAKVSGMSYQAYVQQKLLTPCGMQTAFLDFGGSMAAGHDESGLTSENASLYEGCGTVCASVLDLYRWNLCLHGGKVLTASAYRVMTDPQQGDYGCGVLITEDGLIWHNGELNGYNAYNALDTGSGLMIVLLANNRTYQLHGTTADFPAEAMAPIVLKYAREATSAD